MTPTRTSTRSLAAAGTCASQRAIDAQEQRNQLDDGVQLLHEPEAGLCGRRAGFVRRAPCTHQHQPEYNGVASPQINEYFFMGGASYRFIAREKVAVSARRRWAALAGVSFRAGRRAIPGWTWVCGRMAAGRPSRGERGLQLVPELAFGLRLLDVDHVPVRCERQRDLQNNFGSQRRVIYRFGKR